MIQRTAETKGPSPNCQVQGKFLPTRSHLEERQLEEGFPEKRDVVLIGSLNSNIKPSSYPKESVVNWRRLVIHETMSYIVIVDQLQEKM